jgi:hypothetical protein
MITTTLADANLLFAGGFAGLRGLEAEARTEANDAKKAAFGL